MRRRFLIECDIEVPDVDTWTPEDMALALDCLLDKTKPDDPAWDVRDFKGQTGVLVQELDGRQTYRIYYPPQA